MSSDRDLNYAFAKSEMNSSRIGIIKNIPYYFIYFTSMKKQVIDFILKFAQWLRFKKKKIIAQTNIYYGIHVPI